MSTAIDRGIRRTSNQSASGSITEEKISATNTSTIISRIAKTNQSATKTPTILSIVATDTVNSTLFLGLSSIFFSIPYFAFILNGGGEIPRQRRVRLWRRTDTEGRGVEPLKACACRFSRAVPYH